MFTLTGHFNEWDEFVPGVDPTGMYQAFTATRVADPTDGPLFSTFDVVDDQGDRVGFLRGMGSHREAAIEAMGQAAGIY